LKKQKQRKPIAAQEYSRGALFQAYYDCRKHKRNTMQAIEFEFDLEKNLQKLHEEIINGKYKVGRSICFVVTEPKLREVWAGAFRDRIIHHLIYNAIKERFTSRFIKDTYSCIKGRGTLSASLRAADFAKRITRNYSQKAYYMKADIQNFFNSIDKEVLFEEIKKQVFEPWLLDLIKEVIFHNPKENVFMKSPKSLYEALPQYKRLYNDNILKGLPIGNLTSQFFSNIYLNPLDQFIKHKLKIKYYCRYVDDILLMHNDAEYLNYAYSEIDGFLQNRLRMQLNHKKKNMNFICRGFDFVGHVIKPKRTHLRTRTIKKTIETLRKWEGNPERYNFEELENFRGKINSYLGMLKHVSSYKFRQKICDRATSLFTHSNIDFSKIILTRYKA